MFLKQILVRFFKKIDGEVTQLTVGSKGSIKLRDSVNLTLPESLTTAQMTENVRERIQIVTIHKSKLPKLQSEVTLKHEDTHLKLWVMTSDYKNPGGICTGMFIDFFIEGSNVSVEFTHPSGEVFFTSNSGN